MNKNLLSENDITQIFDSNLLHEPIEISNISNKGRLVELMKKMISIRFVENKISDNVADGTVKCPAHLGVGQEAIAVGLAEHLCKDDRVFGTHRGHAPYLAMGGGIYELFAEVLGKEDGCSKGMGGSQHLFFNKNGYYFSVPIVSGTVPIAVGAALAAKMDNKNGVSICFFGDGAMEEGTVQESLNFAKSHNLPVVFVCENNFFASHMHILERQPNQSVARFAEAHSIKNLIVDGNDVVKVSNISKMAIEQARRTNEPFFIEAVTYRWKGHVGHRDDMDVGVMRSKDLGIWKERDPIARLETALIENNIITNVEKESLYNEIGDLINYEWERAKKATFPQLDVLEKLVYFSNKSMR
ncbi:MAG: thiamine pyrophosphate-dependent dehydrogenase E1 component subunit alpha [Bacteroidetes bacterium]|nr:thiamine pyrophosphate-dependent dehydrogenase E1 component subunit alpha [Bacteroidota bacterium]MBU1114858.1 thiamine pyrophosphate-dependent dehydrogenase E1 component subunit alpha [Bacteroidota bacterium]MBU1797594.1 thiamine pyrophosphate-dependent dehydrogenase E1 component subunit alpha [Bacteroidota bacterium]